MGSGAIQLPQMDIKAFARVSHMLYMYTGIRLKISDRQLVYTRLLRRLKSLDFSDFHDYIDFLESHAPVEKALFISALTTHESRFFREKSQFEIFSTQVLPELISANPNLDEYLVWSTACAKGQEPYSIALSALSSCGFICRQLKILATDIDSEILYKARLGVYAPRELEHVPENIRQQYFAETDLDGNLQIDDKVKRLVRFRELNLNETWPIRKKFSVIFCRNVLIYFSPDMQNRLLMRLVNQLECGGYFFLGHSETIEADRLGLRHIGHHIYKKETSND